TKDIRSFRGIAKVAPRFTLLFMIAVLATVGLPGLSGFVGEFMILIGSFDSSVISGAFAVIAAAGVIIAAIYLLNMFRKMMFGESDEEMQTKIIDLNGREMAVVLPLVTLMFVIGLYASPFLTQINKGSDRVIQFVEEHTEGTRLTDAQVEDPATDERLVELNVAELQQ
ncbi:MAG: proton-conducting transporter membrane subunit, partial [Bacteroidota bacterium]